MPAYGGYVYILGDDHRNRLYIGITSNLIRRMWQHLHGNIPGYASRNRLCVLLYYDLFDRIEEAILREKQLKSWRREKKFALIQEVNPTYQDLITDPGDLETLPQIKLLYE